MTQPAPLDTPADTAVMGRPSPPSMPQSMPGQPTAPMPSVHSARHSTLGPIGEQRGAWAVWLLPFVTFGIYYFVWYYKINKELAAFAPQSVDAHPGRSVVALFVPIANLISLAHTAGRIRDAAAAAGVPVDVSGGKTILASFWFASQTRYLQRRLNTLWAGVGI